MPDHIKKSGVVSIGKDSFEFVDGQGTYPAVLAFRKRIFGLGIGANIVEGSVRIFLDNSSVKKVATVISEYKISPNNVRGFGKAGDYFVEKIREAMGKK